MIEVLGPRTSCCSSWSTYAKRWAIDFFIFSRPSCSAKRQFRSLRQRPYAYCSLANWASRVAVNEASMEENISLMYDRRESLISASRR